MIQVKKVPENVEEYIAGFPENIRVLLVQLRDTIRNAAPEAEEVISYKMPAYKLDGILVYFAAFKNHIGFFPTASGIEAFKKELSAFKCSKGTVQFPLNDKLPVGLITEIVRYRVRVNLEKASKPRGHK
jgi:uncharacterized protein YdhG (YjbR/CyaY superfamily)